MSKRELTPLQLMDRDIMTSFRSRIWSNFTKAVSEYKLIDENDHIASNTLEFAKKYGIDIN